jgi:hypothetical protein
MGLGAPPGGRQGGRRTGRNLLIEQLLDQLVKLVPLAAHMHAATAGRLPDLQLRIEEIIGSPVVCDGGISGYFAYHRTHSSAAGREMLVPVVIAAGGDADLVLGHLVDKPVFVGNSP